MDKKKDEELYKELIQKIIFKQKDILGTKVAVERSKKIEDLWIDSDGKVLQIKGEYQPILQTLINEYFKLTSQAGLETCLEVIRDFVVENKDLKLPEEIEILLQDK